MFENLPDSVQPFMDWEWEQIAPYYEALEKRPLSDETVEQWLSDWTAIGRLLQERGTRLRVATTVDTTNAEAEAAFNTFLKSIMAPLQAAEQQLKTKLLASGLIPEGMEIVIKKMRSEADMFAEENIPLNTEEQMLGARYNKIAGAQTVTWQGEELTLTQLRARLQMANRENRKQMWWQAANRQLEDRDALNQLWQEMIALRQTQAKNAGFDSYLAYRWQYLKRFDYSPADSRAFHEAIAEAVVPAASRIYARKAAEIGSQTLRPWDVLADVFTLTYPALHPMDNVTQLEVRAEQMFYKVDEALGDYFSTMRQEKLLDLPNRKGKGPGGYCTYFAKAKRPFIFMNAVGTAGDVRTMLHEAGHAFHCFEASGLPYAQQRHPGAEFAEVASMAMELLAAPYMAAAEGGYYDDEREAARHRTAHLEKIILFWPYMAVVDGFQHWVYENMVEAADPANCDAKWRELWQRFIPNIDFKGFGEQLETGWHRKLHIFRYPFYYVEYGMAQVGAIQVWRNSQRDKAGAVAAYRHALALGGTKSLPDLFGAAGATFDFGVQTMQETVGLLEREIEQLAN